MLSRIGVQLIRSPKQADQGSAMTLQAKVSVDFQTDADFYMVIRALNNLLKLLKWHNRVLTNGKQKDRLIIL